MTCKRNREMKDSFFRCWIVRALKVQNAPMEIENAQTVKKWASDARSPRIEPVPQIMRSNLVVSHHVWVSIFWIWRISFLSIETLSLDMNIVYDGSTSFTFNNQVSSLVAISAISEQAHGARTSLVRHRSVFN